MNEKILAACTKLLLVTVAVFAICGGTAPAIGAGSPGAVFGPEASVVGQQEPAKQADPEATAQPGPEDPSVVEGPVSPMPAARNMRYSLAEKRVAIEGRKQMIAEIEARKAAQQDAAAQQDTASEQEPASQQPQAEQAKP